ncbi:SDR family oxidoreductase [Kaistia dalseonensis]|uniref:NAD(P)-dependent dehydrogenase (Short-subunit alcohol dehydrogenase family) n=1 Tax=Kaistia dalseonensis TaxID=410840 RepID=A0ABU0HE42_9HYPH|nr:SDR family oxidoreductase [Kaistia dalseonensis]MCX5497474.1 SDR family oxidoreductase [Kaistia dalseonensis]MDQ0440113.1 NAD(P)-dependent dehydrogenase (short-subunit alcohol dehydrogenase family) [Kaistia dalseonensis]
MSFENRTVAIIGGGSGFGFRVATRIIAAGGHVVLGGRSEARLLDAVARLGPRARAQTVDIEQKASIAAFFEVIERVDHLFVPAATYKVGPIDTLSDADAESPFRTKFWGQYHAIKAALPRFAPDGSIVLMAGAAGARPIKGAAAYAAANSAIEGLGRALALELAPIRVNTVSPGTIDGDLWRSRPDSVREPAFALYSQLAALGRPGTEDEVADTVLFLMQNSYMTGSTLYPDGGYALR